MISGYPIAEGGMRFAFPPYGFKKIGTVSLQNNYIPKNTRCKFTVIYQQFMNQQNISILFKLRK
jgi:hypothetical protein